MFAYNGKECKGIYFNGQPCPMYANGVKIWPTNLKFMLDGVEFNSVKIGDYYWSTENIYTSSIGAWYGNNETFAKPLKFGKLYTYSELLGSAFKNKLPEGWRVAKDNEYMNLSAATVDKIVSTYGDSAASSFYKGMASTAASGDDLFGYDLRCNGYSGGWPGVGFWNSGYVASFISPMSTTYQYLIMFKPRNGYTSTTPSLPMSGVDFEAEYDKSSNYYRMGVRLVHDV